MLIQTQGLHISNKDIQNVVRPSRWFVLRFNLSPLTGHGDSAVQSFYNDLLVGLQQFWWLHRNWLQVPDSLLYRRPGEAINSNYLYAAFRITFDLVLRYMRKNGTKTVKGVILIQLLSVCQSTLLGADLPPCRLGG